MTVMKFDCVDYERDGPIAVITMNNPARRNSWSFEMSRGANSAFGQFEEDDDVKVAILTAVGDTFCAGVNILETENLTEEERQRMAAERRQLSRTGAYNHKDRIPKPVIAAVNGAATGMGWFVAMRCDLVVAAESAVFWQAEPFVGFQGGGQAIAVQMLPFHLGVEITLGAKLSAQRCYEIGLVNKVVPDEQLIPAAKEMAEGICELAPLAVKYIIQACRSVRISDLIPSSIALAHFQEYEVLPKTEDVQEGYRARREGRRPQWKGR